MSYSAGVHQLYYYFTPFIMYCSSYFFPAGYLFCAIYTRNAGITQSVWRR